MHSTGLIFNIQRFSIHDGPGIRTTVFLKGCSLHCFWCHNPEGRHPYHEIQFFAQRCIQCGECLIHCPNNAHSFSENRHIFLRESCQGCGACAEGCVANALKLTGRYMTVDQVMEEILKDRVFYETSNGGVTLSGGEPVLQTEFSRAILKRCQAEGLHTAIETCGNYPWEKLETLLPFVDLVIMDIKHLDPVKHRQVSGDTNQPILANAKNLALTDKSILFRIPVVPEVNDTDEEISIIIHFIRGLIELRNKNTHREQSDLQIQIELLPFHQLAEAKYHSLGLEYQARDLKPPTRQRIQHLAEIHGIVEIIS